jgi:hypothetical protein
MQQQFSHGESSSKPATTLSSRLKRSAVERSAVFLPSLQKTLSSRSRLGVFDDADNACQSSWIYITDSDDIQIPNTSLCYVESGLFRLPLLRWFWISSLRQKDRNAVLTDGIEKLCDWLIVQISEVRTVEFCIIGQIVGKIEAERQFTLKPWLDRMPV